MREGGVTFSAWPDDRCPAEHIHANALVKCAGAVAQARAGTAYELADGLGDQFKLSGLADHAVGPGGDVIRTLAEWYNACRELVEQHWQDIETVTEALLARSDLTGKSLSGLLGHQRLAPGEQR